jgi:hypothetical protein
LRACAGQRLPLADIAPALAAAARYLGSACLATAGQLALLLGPALVLAFALHALAALVNRRANRYLGRAYYVLFGWLGTAVHELGHALFCLLFAHRITEIKLFDFAPGDGDLGHVRHAYDRSNPYQLAGNFFIGIGPLLLGTLLIVLAARWLLGPAGFDPLVAVRWESGAPRSPGTWLALVGQVGAGAGAALGALFAHGRLADWRTWVFLYVTFTVGSSMSLSGADLKGALGGFAVLAFLALLGNLATLWMGDVLGRGVAALAAWQAIACAAMSFALAVNALAALVVLTLPGLVSLVRGAPR